MPPVSPGSSALFNHQIEKKNYTSNPNFPINSSIEMDNSNFNTVVTGKNKELLTPKKEKNANNNSTNAISNNNNSIIIDQTTKKDSNKLLDSVVISNTQYHIPTFYDKNNSIPSTIVSEDELILNELPQEIGEKEIENISERLFSMNTIFSNAILRKFNIILYGENYKDADNQIDDKDKDSFSSPEFKIYKIPLKPINKEAFIT